MTNKPGLPPTARAVFDPTTLRLRQLAAQEAAVRRERLATRTAAARSFSAAVARVADAKDAWEHVQAEARRVQSKAVEDFLCSGLAPSEVAELLGISNRELRTLRKTTAAPVRKTSRPTDGAGSDPKDALATLQAPNTLLAS
jgi:hypothetical protein